ncbi:unnamed protein product [Arctogadus glacialis]
MRILPSPQLTDAALCSSTCLRFQPQPFYRPPSQPSARLPDPPDINSYWPLAPLPLTLQTPPSPPDPSAPPPPSPAPGPPS